jgi:hypothetical protein
MNLFRGGKVTSSDPYPRRYHYSTLMAVLVVSLQEWQSEDFLKVLIRAVTDDIAEGENRYVKMK